MTSARIRSHVIGHASDMSRRPVSRGRGDGSRGSRPSRRRRWRVIDQDRDTRRQIRQLERRIDELLDEHGTTLLDEPGVGPIIAATLICEVGDSCRFAREAKFPRWCGTGAVAVSSGEGNNEPVRHRLDIGGNRRVNSMLYIISVTQQRDHPDARRYLARKAAEGKTRREARRAHKRQLANRIIRRMWRDEHTRRRRLASAA